MALKQDMPDPEPIPAPVIILNVPEITEQWRDRGLEVIQQQIDAARECIGLKPGEPVWLAPICPRCGESVPFAGPDEVPLENVTCPICPEVTLIRYVLPTPAQRLQAELAKRRQQNNQTPA